MPELLKVRICEAAEDISDFPLAKSGGIIYNPIVRIYERRVEYV